MKNLSIEHQIGKLRPAVSSGLANNLHLWLLAFAALFAILAIYFWNPIPLMIAGFLGLVGFCEQRTGPNIVAAIKAYDTSIPTTGEVLITISSGDTDSYYALVQEQNQLDWKYDFIPQGWSPTTGTHIARIWRRDDGCPVLTVIGDGILIPRSDPKH
jgi:hypothetical protein